MESSDPPSTPLLGGGDPPCSNQLTDPNSAQSQDERGFSEAEPDFSVIWGPIAARRMTCDAARCSFSARVRAACS